MLGFMLEPEETTDQAPALGSVAPHREALSCKYF